MTFNDWSTQEGKPMYTILSGLIGALTAVMIYLNGGLASRIGNYASSTFIHLSGLILVAIMLVLTRSKSPFQKTIPPMLLSGGALGFLTVVCANVGFMNLGGVLDSGPRPVGPNHFGTRDRPLWLARGLRRAIRSQENRQPGADRLRHRYHGLF